MDNECQELFQSTIVKWSTASVKIAGRTQTTVQGRDMNEPDLCSSEIDKWFCESVLTGQSSSETYTLAENPQ